MPLAIPDEITKLIGALKNAAEFVMHELALAVATQAHMDRGRALPLTARERVNRMLYLAGELPLSRLDNGIDKRTETVLAISGYADPDGDGEVFCPDGFYRLNGKHDGLPAYNGGKDPRAPDPFDRWRKPGSTFVNRTADCAAGVAWVSGYDRFQPERFAHIYKGWINTDSMILDAVGPQRCFVPLEEPEDGCIIVCASGSPGHKVGHTGGVPKARAGGFDRNDRRHWKELGVVDIASRGASRANKRTTAEGWYGTGALFLRPILAAA